MQTRLATANCDETRTLFFLFFALTFASVAENSRGNFLSPSDVFARNRENHVKSRFRAVIYVNETLTTSTKFYGPELTLRPPGTHRVLVPFFFSISSTYNQTQDAKQAQRRRETERKTRENWRTEENGSRKSFLGYERSLRNDHSLKLALMIHHGFPRVSNKDEASPLSLASRATVIRVTSFLVLLFLRWYTCKSHSILAEHLTQRIISSSRGNTVPSFPFSSLSFRPCKSSRTSSLFLRVLHEPSFP